MVWTLCRGDSLQGDALWGGRFVGGRIVEGTLCIVSPTISISRETIATETRNRGIDNMIEALMEQFGPQKVKLH